MARRKLISDQEILKAKLEIKNGKSLREMARNLGIHPSSLSDRLHKLNNQLTISELTKPDTKPDTKEEIGEIITRQPIIKPDTKPDKIKKHLSISLLRGLHELLLGYSDQHKLNRKELLEVLIKEFEKQKKSIN